MIKAKVMYSIAAQGLAVARTAFASAWPEVMEVLEEAPGDAEIREEMRSIERAFIKVEHHLRKAAR
jgi:hypothetical protein